MYEDEIMKTAHKRIPAAEPCRDWKDTLVDVLLMIAILIVGIVIGIGICKCCPPFWSWLNSGWMEAPWIPKALIAAGGLCISVALCIGEDK